MKLLKERVMEIVNNVNQNWVKALSGDADDPKVNNRDISHADMMGKFSEEIKNLNQHFNDYEERKKKGRGFFR